MNEIEQGFEQAIALVSARVRNDTGGMAAVLDGLDRDGLERVATALAAAFAQYGVEASGGPDAFLRLLTAMRERF